MKVLYDMEGEGWKCWMKSGCVVYKGYGLTKEEAYVAMMQHRDDLMDRLSVDYH